METFAVELPNGKVMDGVPVGTTKTEIMTKAVRAGLASWEDFADKQQNPTEGSSKFVAGFGKAFVDLGRGAQQVTGIGDQDELQARIDESKRLDAPLMKTGAGIAGNLVGNVAAALPVATFPGANTVAGSALLGAAQGALSPVATGESRASNAFMGGVFGAGGQVLGNLVPRVVGAVVAPFHKAGRERIAADTLRRFVQDPARIGQAATSRVPGVQYTLAEATQDPGLAVLQRASESLDPQVAGALAERNSSNLEAVRSTLRGMSGDEAAREAAVKARDQAVKTLYANAGAETVPVDRELVEILKRPEVAAAFKRVQNNAANAGAPVPKPAYTPAGRVADGLSGWKDVPEQFGEITGDTLHQLKMALDDALVPNPQRGIGKSDAKSIGKARDALLGWLEDKIPDYADARTTFADMSKPINQQEVAKAFGDVLIPALTESEGVLARARAEQFANALRNPDALVRRATGFEPATFENVMTPSQIDTLRGVEAYLSRRAGAAEAARGAGSNTAQNLTGQNLIRQITGPLGLPQSVAESTLADVFGRGWSVAIKPAETRIQQRLSELLLDPQNAQQALRVLNPSQAQQFAEALYQRALPAASIGSGAYAAGQ